MQTEPPPQTLLSQVTSGDGPKRGTEPPTLCLRLQNMWPPRPRPSQPCRRAAIWNAFADTWIVFKLMLFNSLCFPVVVFIEKADSAGVCSYAGAAGAVLHRRDPKRDRDKDTERHRGTSKQDQRARNREREAQERRRHKEPGGPREGLGALGAGRVH